MYKIQFIKTTTFKLYKNTLKKKKHNLNDQLV